MKYQIYTTSKKAWDGMLGAIRAAQSSIYIEMYIFLDDTKETHDFIGVLKEKAAKGIKVVVVADYFGSFSLQKKTIEELRQTGVEFLYFNGLFKRTHRKLVIVDRKFAFLGGVNIEEKIRNWRDLQIGVRGRIVLPILRSFARIYLDCGGVDENIKQYALSKPVKKLKSWIVENIPGTNRLYYLNSYYREKMGGAKDSIKIVTPYLSPPRWLLSALSNAVERGVRVEIMMPQDTDIKVVNRINMANAARLSDFGVHIYLGRQMNHAKAMIIDRQEGVIGSQNFDILSFGMNMELGIFFTQKDLIDKICSLFEKWKEQAVLFSESKQKTYLFDRILLLAIKFLYPIF